MGRIDDVTDSINNLNVTLDRIKESPISEKNKKFIMDFMFSLRRENLRRATIINHLNTLRWTCEYLQSQGIDKPLTDLESFDFDMLLFFLEDEKNLKPGTINQFKKSYKKFANWHYGEDNLPKWIQKLRQQKTETRIQPADIPTKEDFSKFLAAAEHPRDKAIIATLADGGIRISALLSCKINSVQQNQYGAILYLSRDGANKTTGAKGIPLTWSSGYLERWLAIHPQRENLTAPLFTTFRSSSGEIEALNYFGAYKVFERINRKAGISKYVHPHMMRHYAVTSWILDGLRDQDINHRAGWAKDSKQMYRVYGNFSDQEMNDRIYEHYGLKTEDRRTIQLKKCPRCNNVLRQEDRFCSQCSLVLDQRALIEQQNLEDQARKLSEMLLKLDPNKLNELLKNEE